tara:strand:+ start:337 stop:978 length:642 start_codon:yes stop_codon:yes gene_type:complete
MRLSSNAKYNMKRKILQELYEAAEESAQKRQSNIAKRNNGYLLEPYKHILDQLPSELIAHAYRCTVLIKYKADPDNPTRYALDTTWSYDFDTPTITFVDQPLRSYSHITTTSTTLDPRLYQDAAGLAEELLALQKEKQELTDYLDHTLEQWSGTKQLETVWPVSLHKYLPVTSNKLRGPLKKSKNTAIKNIPTASAAPIGLGERLTTNLLEGS